MVSRQTGASHSAASHGDDSEPASSTAAASRSTAEAGPAVQAATSSVPARKVVNNITARTRFLDDLVLTLTGAQPPADMAAPLSAQQHFQHMVKQAARHTPTAEGTRGTSIHQVGIS